jgi:NADH-quinone oxidoreductase subunit L
MPGSETMDPMISTALWILFLPLLSYVILFFVGEKLPRRGDWVGIGILGICLLLSLRIFAHFWVLDDPSHRIVWNVEWLRIGSFHIDFGILVDGMTAVMLMVVSIVSFVVHLFSSGYMWGDRRYSRYFAFLGWFTFSMLGIVLSSSVFFLYIFWELVGLASYLLIGFFFDRPSAAAANKKAFLTNRVGDFGFWIGILLFYTAVGSFEYLDLFTGVQSGALTGAPLSWAGVLLFMGCVGKSAQVPLHVWLPDAMEGPTPVSALIHAATMVAAGVYMTARLFPLFDPTALLVIAYVGAFTALFAATIAIVQTDIKRGLAYSTISQLGYMVMAVGVGGVMSGLFHLTTHAMFKACLFLGSGAVIHALHHEQDMRAMGGLRHKMPITFMTFLLATIAISGVPPLSGFWSKDAILGAALAFGMTHPGHYLPFIFTIVAASITAFYMFRIVFLTFTGKPRDEHKHAHAHEVGWRMSSSLVILAFLAVIGGGLPWAGWSWFERFVVDPRPAAAELHAPEETHELTLGESTGPATMDSDAHGDEHALAGESGVGESHAEDADAAGSASEEHAQVGDHGPGGGAEHADHEHVHHVAHQRAMWLSLLAAGLGILVSWLTYVRRRIRSESVLAAMPGTHRVLWHKYYFDEFYGAVVWRGLLLFNAALFAFDKYVVDGLVNAAGYLTRAGAWLSGMNDRYFIDGLVNATGDLLRSLGGAVSQLQTGRVQTYFLGLVSGLVILILVYRAVWLS